MASNYRIEAGQPDRSTPTQQYPPYYDPQKQKEKQDLENSPLQLIGLFAQAKQFEAPSWLTEESSILNEELRNDMAHILMSDYSPHAKNYAAASLLVDNLFGEKYNLRTSLESMQKGETEYNTEISQYVASKKITTDQAEMYRKINSMYNKKDYDVNKGNSKYMKTDIGQINNFDNYYNEKFSNAKQNSIISASGASGGFGSGTGIDGSGRNVLTGTANISLNYYDEESYSKDVATVVHNEFTAEGYTDKINLLKKYEEALRYEGNLNEEEIQNEIIFNANQMFANAPALFNIDENGNRKLISSNEEFVTATVGLTPDEIMKGQWERNGKTYYTNYEEFKNNNKEKFLSQKDIDLMEGTATKISKDGTVTRTQVTPFDIDLHYTIKPDDPNKPNEKVAFTLANDILTAQSAIDAKTVANDYIAFSLDTKRASIINDNKRAQNYDYSYDFSITALSSAASGTSLSIVFPTIKSGQQEIVKAINTMGAEIGNNISLSALKSRLLGDKNDAFKKVEYSEPLLLNEKTIEELIKKDKKDSEKNKSTRQFTDVNSVKKYLYENAFIQMTVTGKDGNTFQMILPINLTKKIATSGSSIRKEIKTTTIKAIENALSSNS